MKLQIAVVLDIKLNIHVLFKKDLKKNQIKFLAHNHIRSLRQNIKTLSNTTSDAILEEIREKIGAAIYTIQEFYSNTNWIELNGPVVYKEFGKSKCNITLSMTLHT